MALFHYVVAAIGALFAYFPLIPVALGIMMVVNPDSVAGAQGAAAPPPGIGYLCAGIGAWFVLLGWTAACTFGSGRYLARRKGRMFSFIVAGFFCVFFPFGTVLGIFAIIVLSRDAVRRLYETA